MRYAIYLALLMLVFSRCGSKKAAPVARTVAADTTQVLPHEVFTTLALDSAQVEGYIRQGGVDEKTAMQLHTFYRNRSYQYAWFTEEGLSEAAQAFWHQHNQYVNFSRDSTVYDKELHARMDSLLGSDDYRLQPQAALTSELQLTQHFFAYAKLAYQGRLDPEEMQWFIPRKRVDVVSLLDTLTARQGKDLAGWEPLNFHFRRLKEELLRYYAWEKAGGWETIEPSTKKSLRLGDSSGTVTALKKRLSMLGDLPGVDTSRAFTKELEEAVKSAQQRFGLKPDGVAGAGLLKELNVPVEERIQQLLINLERMRWLPADPKGKRLVVNIPEFRLHILEDQEEAGSMDIVVGKSANKTVIFTGQLKYVVFSPYWNVPMSIVRNEIQPAMKRNSSYLQRNNMEITGYSNGLPVIRQLPGDKNALGRVKFLFPNQFNIYLHDTPAKTLFSQTSRAFSHGCIRLSRPAELASYLLKDYPAWTPDRVEQEMKGTKEKWVTLEKGIPVFIGYFTAWVDASGKLNFREDIYGHDKNMSKHLFRQGEHSHSSGTKQEVAAF
jgi:murein L,D-transpeptidase YcbB/YkuD